MGKVTTVLYSPFDGAKPVLRFGSEHRVQSSTNPNEAKVFAFAHLALVCLHWSAPGQKDPRVGLYRLRYIIFPKGFSQTSGMRAQTKELWLELCEQAANEQDSDKFRAIVLEIRVALELKTGRLGRSSPKLASSQSALVRCALCQMPVPLESVKTDENGKAVHEECYLLTLRLEQATTPPKD
jgi:hypothetical protein